MEIARGEPTSASVDGRPVWRTPEVTEIAINDVTGCCFALGGNDGTPSVTSVS